MTPHPYTQCLKVKTRRSHAVSQMELYLREGHRSALAVDDLCGLIDDLHQAMLWVW